MVVMDGIFSDFLTWRHLTLQQVNALYCVCLRQVTGFMYGAASLIACACSPFGAISQIPLCTGILDRRSTKRYLYDKLIGITSWVANRVLS